MLGSLHNFDHDANQNRFRHGNFHSKLLVAVVVDNPPTIFTSLFPGSSKYTCYFKFLKSTNRKFEKLHWKSLFT